ncbi:MAG: hypothetical protein AAF721_18980 [Myxococcota bacterium]
MTRKTQAKRSGRSRLAGAAVKIAALVLMVVGIVAVSPESSARLYPYYIVRNASVSVDVRPRILFVLDTSGSMSLRAQSAAANCDWDECESVANEGTVNESRIASARGAIQNVVQATADDATYALMTFDQLGAWGSSTVPTMCAGARRFEWVTSFSYAGDTDIFRYADQGAWRLCQGDEIRPYPYLRWDDLGQGSTISANDQPIGGVGPSPLLAEANVPDWQNAYRSVQWFDRFVGVHFQPNLTTDPDRSITYATTGDWGITNADKDANVYDNDFYYWPYVDGFPGYGQHELSPQFDGLDAGGIAGATGAFEAELYAPFYIDNLPPMVLPGPLSADEARNEVLSKTAKMIEGGVDSAGVTPWASIVGLEPVGLPPQSNDYGSHTSIASYLSFVTTVTPDAICVPTAAVLISDGEPFPATEGGATLYERLAALRNNIGIETYVVGFFLSGSPEINNMACAAAGACSGGSGCATPCADTPANSWDTCADPDNPTTACAWQATSSTELQTVLTEIINVAVDLDVPSGPGATVNQFLGDPGSGDGVLQTRFTSRTEYPSWQGHLARAACDDVDEFDVLLPHCVVPTVPPELDSETYSDAGDFCEPSLVWNAGECLQNRAWNDRLLYTHDDANRVFRIAEADGTATAEFETLLDGMGLLNAVDPEAHADAVAAYVLGRDAPNNWKLPGLANSAPVIVRRMPEYRSDFTPPVAINDPHCGGRFIGAAGTLPESLNDYARAVNDDSTKINTPSPHFEQQEAVIVADDMGVIHGFELDAGEELWGIIPRFALTSLVAQADIGAATYGQDGEIEDHNYGVASTLNHGWVYDDSSTDPDDHTWRHLGVIGMGIGGYEWLVLDLSHMSPESPSLPIEVLWTSEDPTLKAEYDRYNGETWARPAIAYHVDADTATNEPDAFLVMGSGYPDESGGVPPTEQGRTLMRADILTGTIIEAAQLPDIVHDVYEDSFGALVDTAVGTHCLSRFWAEAQESYVADPAGRLFRWDLGRTAAHESDSRAVWGTAAQPVNGTPFYACTGATTCTATTSNPGDPFLFPAAVSANDRIDDFLSGTAGALNETDQFLVALISGSAADDSLTPDMNFHSSVYVMVDDHSGPSKGDGFTIPSGTSIALPGTDENFMRMPVSQIERVRRFQPFPSSSVLERTANFSPQTRPIRAPRIFVTGVVDEDSVGDGLSPILLDGVEVYFIEFTLYEPPSAECDSDWYDSATGQWYQDPGQTYTVTFRLTNSAATPFNLADGADDDPNVDFGGSFGSSGLVLDSVTQLGGTDCQGGDCGADPVPQGTTPCDNNDTTTTSTTTAFSLTAYQSELQGFTPVE